MQARLLYTSGSFITLVFTGNPPIKGKTAKQNFPMERFKNGYKKKQVSSFQFHLV